MKFASRIWRNPATFLLFLFLIIFSCAKDDTPEDTPIDDPGSVDGRFSAFISCNVIAPPPEVGLDNYYKKYINCDGIPIIASNDVPDEALEIASSTIAFMLDGLNAVTRQLISDGNYVALYPEGGSLSDLPENFPGGPNSTGAYSWNDIYKAAASDTASLLCNPDVGYGHTLVHEMAHMIDIGGIRRINSAFQSQLRTRYDQARASGKWDNTYARTNPEEYLAEAVTIWYGVNWIGPEGGDGSRNEIGTRKQLMDYDPPLHELINVNFNDDTSVPGCRTPVIFGATADCDNTVTDIDGNVYEVVNIGPMCWMKENLRTTRYSDGSAIQDANEKSDWANANSGAWANYDSDPSNDETFGKLYNGYALANDKLCPDGWHVPSIQELQDLVNYGGGDHTSFNLRSNDSWDPSSIPATDDSGFSALAAGIRTADGFFQGLGNRTNLGSRTGEDNSKQYSKAIFGDQVFVFTDNSDKKLGFSCRCIQD